MVIKHEGSFDTIVNSIRKQTAKEFGERLFELAKQQGFPNDGSIPNVDWVANVKTVLKEFGAEESVDTH